MLLLIDFNREIKKMYVIFLLWNNIYYIPLSYKGIVRSDNLGLDVEDMVNNVLKGVLNKFDDLLVLIL